MANPTTNYGWPMPTSSNLVTDLPADFDAFGQPVDNTLKALNPETTLGDISYRSAVSNTNTRLGIGTAGQVLAVSGGVPAWTTTADVTPLTTKGDLFTFTTEDARIGVGADGTVLTAASGEATGLQWAAPYAPAAVSHVRAISSTTSVPAATWTKVIFATESYDTLSEFASSRFTAATTGYYNVSAGVCSDAGAIILGSQMIVAIYKNGAAFQLGSSYTYPGGVTARGSAFISTGLSLTATDYIEIYVLQSLTGGTLALSNSDGPQTFVSIDRLQD
jgi:hypothetical protein